MSCDFRLQMGHGHVMSCCRSVRNVSRSRAGVRSRSTDRFTRGSVVLNKYALPVTGPLFDNAYAYISENY